MSSERKALKRLHLLLPVAVLALCFGLLACGGGDGGGEEDEIVEVIETSATSSDPADCKALATQAFLEQTEAAQGKEALENCEESAEESEDDPKSVEVSEVEVDGSAATANVAFTGSNFDGQTLTVALVEESEDWKLDEITGFAELDKEQLGTTLEEALEDEETFDPKVVSCTGEAVRKLPDAKAEEMMLGGSAAVLIELIEDCAPTQQ
jgi:hypothetical protein